MAITRLPIAGAAAIAVLGTVLGAITATTGARAKQTIS